MSGLITKVKLKISVQIFIYFLGNTGTGVIQLFVKILFQCVHACVVIGISPTSLVMIASKKEIS